MKKIITLILLSFTLASCNNLSQINQTNKAKFTSVYRAAKEIEGAAKVGVSYNDLTRLTQEFSSEIAIVKDKVSKDEDRNILAMYEAALECYEDSLTLWNKIIEYKLNEGGEGAPAIIDTLRPLLIKYDIQLQYDNNSSITVIPKSALGSIWAEAVKKTNEANDIVLGKRSYKDVFQKSKVKEVPYAGQVVMKSHSDYGNDYVDQGDYDKAISEYNKAIEINPKLAELYYNRGNAYYQQGNLDQAISDFTKAIELNPAFGMAYYYRSAAYAKEGNYDKSTEDIDRTKELGFKPDSKFEKLWEQAMGIPEEDSKIDSSAHQSENNVEGILIGADGKYKAMVNGKVVSEGSYIGDVKIEKINKDSLDIMVNGQAKNIKVGERCE